MNAKSAGAQERDRAAMQAWIAEQRKHFSASDLDRAVQLMRGYARTKRNQQSRSAA